MVDILDHSGGAVESTLALDFDAGDLTCTLSTTDGWPSGGANGKFWVTFEPETSREEHSLAASRSGNVLTFSSLSDRGLDDTATYTHLTGAIVRHTYSSDEAHTANQHFGNSTLDHHLQYMRTDGTRHDLTARHSAGTVVPTAAATALTVGGGNSEGAGTNLARSTHTHAITRGTPVSVGTANAAGSSGNFAGADHTHAISATAAHNIMPIGAVIFVAGATPTNYLFCDGSAVSRTTYSTLFAYIGTTYGAGDGSTTFNVPNIQQKFILGRAASGTGSALGSTGGTIDHVHDLATGAALLDGNSTGGLSPFWRRKNGVTSWTADIQLSGGANTTGSSLSGITRGVQLDGDTDTANPPYIALNPVIMALPN